MFFVVCGACLFVVCCLCLFVVCGLFFVVCCSEPVVENMVARTAMVRVIPASRVSVGVDAVCAFVWLALCVVSRVV